MEVYGVKPKMFTKEWWPYFWEYYKIQTIVVVFAIIAIVTTVYQLVTAPEYDFYMTYTASQPLKEEILDAFNSEISEHIYDKNGDGEKLMLINEYSFVEDNLDAQYVSAMITKLQLDFVLDEVALFIFTEDKEKFLFDSDSMEGAFIPLTEWVEGEIPLNLKLNDYAISLKNSSICKKLGIPGEDFYVGVRNYPNIDEDLQKQLDTAKNVAKILIK